MSDILVIIGEGQEYDCEVDDRPRLAIEMLGEEVRDQWMCSGCHSVGCLVFVESYNEHHSGSSYGLCEDCIAERLTRNCS